MSGHTPGPWELAPFNEDECEVLDVVSGYKELPGRRVEANWIAECNLQEDPKENFANARLIAAAPDLLEAAKLSEAILSEVFGSDPGKVAEENPAIAGILRLLRPAIAKAEGR